MSRARRAKKSKLPKKLLLILILILGISIGIFNYKPEIETQIASIIGNKVQSYDANNYVKEIFTENNTKYLPIVYNNKDEKITKADIITKFSESGIRIKSIPDTIKTGSQIVTTNPYAKENADTTYIVLIYGDVNGDGEVDVFDAQKIVRHLLYEGNSNYTLTGLNRKAANVHQRGTDVLDIYDAQRIVQFVLSKTSIIDNLPTSDISKDNARPVIELIGGDENDHSVKVDLYGTYTEYGAKVSDDWDPNVRLDINSSGVNTNQEGTYKVIYTATDASGKQTVVERTVIVGSVTPAGKTTISFNVEGDLAVEVGDTTALAKLDLGATAIDTVDGDLTSKIVMTGWEDEFINIPGKYTITYMVENSEKVETTKTRILEVVDPVVAITVLTPDSSVGTALKKVSYNEGEELNLEGPKVMISRKSGGQPEEALISELDNNYEIVVLENSPFIKGTDGKYYATYREVDTSNDTTANTNLQLKIKVIYTNPAADESDPNRVISSSDTSTPNLGLLSVKGKIRDFVNDAEFMNGNVPIENFQKDIYELVNIAKISTKPYQEDLTSNNISYVVSKLNDDKVTYTELDLTTSDRIANINQNVTSGIASYSFWAKEVGTYKIKITAKSDKDSKFEATKEVTVTLGTSDAVDVINIGTVVTDENNITKEVLYDGVLKAGGTYKDIPVTFIHNYGEASTKVEPLSINVKAGRVRTDTGATTDMTIQLLKTVEIEGKKQYEVISAGDTESFVTGIRVTAASSISVPSNKNSVPRELRVHTDFGTAEARSSLAKTVEVYKQSIYSIKFDGDYKDTENANTITKDINLYLSGQNVTDLVFTDTDGTLYTLLAAKKVDQYWDTPYNDPSSQPLLASDLDNIVFKDGVNDGKEYIKVLGFDSNLQKRSGDVEISYVGIAVSNLDDADEKLVENGNKISVYEPADTLVSTLNIVKIEKKPITNLQVSLLKNTDYRYSKDSVIAQIKTGRREKDLEPGQLTYSITKVNDEGNMISANTGATYKEKSVVNGKVNLEFMSPDIGNFKIEVTLKSNTNIKASAIIKIKENPKINKVGFRVPDSNNPTTESFGNVSKTVSVMREIVYYHDYSLDGISGVGVKEIDSSDIPTIGATTLTPNVAGMKVTPFGGKFEIPTTAERDRVRLINIECAEASMIGSYDFNIHITQNIDGKEYVFNDSIPVNIVEKIGITSVILNPVNGGTTADLYYPTTEKPKNTFEADGLTYAVFEIAFVDSSGTKYKVPASRISDKLFKNDNNDWILITGDDAAAIPGIAISSISAKPAEAYNETASSGSSIITSYREAEENSSVSYVGIALNVVNTTPNAIKVYLNPQTNWTTVSPKVTMTINKMNSPTDVVAARVEDEVKDNEDKVISPKPEENVQNKVPSVNENANPDDQGNVMTNPEGGQGETIVNNDDKDKNQENKQNAINENDTSGKHNSQANEDGNTKLEDEPNLSEE